MVFGATVLLRGVSFAINRRDRIALVGRNGAGKSTLLKIIAGMQSPSAGIVARDNDLTIGYLPQQMSLVDDCSLRDEVAKAFVGLTDVEAAIDRINHELQTRDDYESREYSELVEALALRTEQLSVLRADNRDEMIERTLTGLGFERSDFARPTSEFSGGWRMRVELAKLLLQRPDVLLLDEPTNHLDIDSIMWLEGFLKSRAGALVLVSHDRAFLDNVTTRTVELSLGNAYDYAVPYSRYVALRAERLEQQRRAYDNQQKMIQDTEAFIERFRYQATKAIQVQSRIKWLERLERIEIDEVDTSRLRLRFPPAPRSGDYPIIAEDVAKSFGSLQVFSGVSFRVKRGEKVAFVGRNGAGKSTLVKCIMGELDHEGSLIVGHNVKIGYFAQNEAQRLDESLTVFDTIDRVATGEIRTRINDLLGAFMFGGAAADKPVRVLSGGERSRLAMLRLLLQPVNLLILDEPTNHLDMSTKDVLKEAIRNFDGTVIVVSHDREFLDGLVSKVYEFGGGRVVEHLGGIYEFLQRRQLDSLSQLEAKGSTQPAGAEGQPAGAARRASEGSLNYQAQKERERRHKQLVKRVATLEQQIADLEAQIAALEDDLASGRAAQSPEVYERHGALSASLADALEQWEQACADLEQDDSQRDN